MFSALAFVMVILTVATIILDIHQYFIIPTKLPNTPLLTTLTDLKLLLLLAVSFHSIACFLASVAVFIFAGFLVKASKGYTYKIGYIWGRTNNMPTKNIVEHLMLHRFPLHLTIAAPSILILLRLI